MEQTHAHGLTAPLPVLVSNDAISGLIYCMLRLHLLGFFFQVAFNGNGTCIMINVYLVVYFMFKFSAFSSSHELALLAHVDVFFILVYHIQE